MFDITLVVTDGNRMIRNVLEFQYNPVLLTNGIDNGYIYAKLNNTIKIVPSLEGVNPGH